MKRETLFRATPMVHTYKITKNAGLLFYRTTDRLVLFSVISVLARKHSMRVAGLCFMFTHLHEALAPLDDVQLESFERDETAIVSRLFNKDRGLAGSVFKRPFGRASKKDPKSQKSCIVYILNNPPEKKLCRHAIDDRWNFLAYYHNPNPFSKPLVKHRASYYLREACSAIDHEFAAGRYLRPEALRRLFSKIAAKDEKEQLVDYIITKYNFIDYESAIELFGSYKNMVAATDAMTGAEYDVGEIYDVRSDVPYSDLVRYAAKDGLLGPDMKLLHLEPEERIRHINRYMTIPGVTDKHLRAFFHMDNF